MMTMQNNSYRSGLMVAERRGFDLCVSFFLLWLYFYNN